jgi:site-specific DNA recombinase
VRAAVYTRVSTDEQAREGYSLGEQERSCVERIAHEGWTPAGVYSDPGQSGADRDRPGLARLLAALDQIDVVVLAAFDRLCRDAAYFFELSARFAEAGVQVVSLRGETMSGDDSASFLSGGIMAVFADYERRRIKERTRDGVRARLRAGLPQGQAPYGYRREGGGMVVVEDEVPSVRRVFNEFVGGRPLKQIAEGLNKSNVPTKRGGQWAASTVRGMLRCALYVGRMRDGTPAQHEPIVDEELFARAQALIGPVSVGRTRSGPRRRYIFTGGMLRCGECESAMTPKSQGKRDTYICRGRSQLGKDCSQGPVSRTEIDDAVFAHFDKLLHDLDATIARVGEAAREALDETNALLAQAERAANQAAARIERVKRAFQDDKIDAEDWREQRDQLTAEQEAAEAEVKRLRKAAKRRPPVQSLAQLRNAVATEVAEAPNVDAVRAVLRATYEGFVLHRGLAPEGITAADAGALEAGDYFILMDPRDDAWVYLGLDDEPELRRSSHYTPPWSS